MRRALRLAARGRGRTSPNPMVGATIVAADGTVLGDGWHERAGTPHAEVHALEAAGPRARGAMLICTLEPCCHHGRTGPCVERIVAAGIAHVVVATEDPNPRVAGGGLRYLSAHGVGITCGIEAAAARALNAPFFTAMRHQRPWVILKVGASLDGRIAAAPGVRTEITGPEARREVQRLRAEVDAVAVGSGTVLADDPQLTVRDVCRMREQVRIVFDRRLRTPPGARLLAAPGRTLILTSGDALANRPDRAAALERAGAELAGAADTVADGLRFLAGRGIQSVLLEGGATLSQAAWDAGMIDEVRLYVSPDALGPSGVPLFAAGGWDVGALAGGAVRSVGRDTLIHHHVHRPD